MQKTLSVINLRNIRANALKIRAKTGNKKLFAVVKADAYGHGAEEVARAIEDVCDGFCVAITDEGAALRIAGISKPILVFAPPLDRADVERSALYGLDLTVNSVKTARLIGGLSAECRLHIKVNTGMNRTGCNLKELPEVLRVADTRFLEGVYSHLYAPQNAAACHNQLKIFNRAEELVRSKKPDVCAHISASGGLLRGGGFIKDGVRAGILLYGYAPSGFSASGFKPAMRVYARRTQQTGFIGGGVGYNYADREYKRLSAYRLGYADGFLRGVPLGEKTLCMDAFLRNGGGELLCVMKDADEYARRCGTISYEVLTSVTRRSEKIYVR